jgi:hypothetical protein
VRLIAQQAEGYPTVVMKQSGSDIILCHIPNEQTVIKIADEGNDYRVRWNDKEGLVKKSNTRPAPMQPFQNR